MSDTLTPPSLADDIDALDQMIDEDALATTDPLGIGGLLIAWLVRSIRPSGLIVIKLGRFVNPTRGRRETQRVELAHSTA